MQVLSTLRTPRSALSYQEALDFWFGRINYEQRAPKPSDLKLDRMRTLLRLLGNPEQKVRIVHVAGSKGKGSISAMLEAILRQAGYRTGLFTSPHLSQVEERIQVDGVLIRPEQLASLITDIVEVARSRDGEMTVESGNGTISLPRHLTTSPPDRSSLITHHSSLSSLTFFEVATALGFLHFARRRVDVAVVEVGLGGRFDSTNVCWPMVSVISSISLDHTQQLGDRLGNIAMEKAGIIKPGRPTVSGVTVAEAQQVIEDTCRVRRSPHRQLGTDFHYHYEPGQVRNQELDISSHDGVTHHSSLLTHNCFRPSRVRVVTLRRAWPTMELSLLGEHQAANAAVVVACVEQLREQGLHIGDEAVRAGLAGVYWPARMEVLSHRPLVVLDCAHNVASAQALVDTLLSSFPPLKFEIQCSRTTFNHSPLTTHHSPNCTLGRRLLIFAGSSDKDLTGMLRILAPHFAHAFLTRFRSPRGVPPEQLADMLRTVAPLPFTLCSSPADAWQAARSAAEPNDLICITGSLFLAGEVRPLLLEGSSQKLWKLGKD
jgi:dihydrofolate synthase/folylpolyglutamate synthase